MHMKGFLVFGLFLILSLSLISAPNVEDIGLVSEVSSIYLAGHENEIEWDVEGYSSQGFKVVWSKNENPEYPLRDGDKYFYFTDPEEDEAELEAFEGSGLYYVRVCEYLGGECGVYSNQIELELGIDKDEVEKEDEYEHEQCVLTVNNHNYIDYICTEGQWFKSSLNILKLNEDSVIIHTEGEFNELTTGMLKEGDSFEVYKVVPKIRYKITVEEIGFSIDNLDRVRISIKVKGEIEDDEIKEGCDGCLIGDKCVPVCYRSEGTYCSIRGELINQSIEGSVCDNSCECESNVCAGGECISANTIQKVLNWFKNLFG